MKKKNKNFNKFQEAWLQVWDESESGWGVRPDGYSLHLTEEDAKAYVKQYWNEEKKRNPSGSIPHEYSRESGSADKVLVSPELYAKLEGEKPKKRRGLRLWNSDLDIERLKVVTERVKK